MEDSNLAAVQSERFWNEHFAPAWTGIIKSEGWSVALEEREWRIEARVADDTASRPLFGRRIRVPLLGQRRGSRFAVSPGIYGRFGRHPSPRKACRRPPQEGYQLESKAVASVREDSKKSILNKKVTQIWLPKNGNTNRNIFRES